MIVTLIIPYSGLFLWFDSQTPIRGFNFVKDDDAIN